MGKNKKKRKSSAPHNPVPPPARPVPMDGRRFVSYEDLETMPTPPVPRHMVSYASSDGEDEEPSNAATPKSEASAAEHRHRIMSRESDGTYDANRAQPRTDTTYGQVGAFPGLDTYQFAPFYGPANDGLDYLRMVRSEARDIPHIVTSKTRKRVVQQAQQDYEEQPVEEEMIVDEDEEEWYAAQMAREEADGYYSDGAYVAKPLARAIGPQPVPTINPQDAYYDRLKHLFAHHRARCHASPSADAVAALDHRHPISYPQGSVLATNEWKKLLIETAPLPAQLCSMEKWSVFRLLRLCERSLRAYTIRMENVPSNLAQWIWGLLGRLPESCQMRNEEVSKIRELGKFATWCTTEYKFANDKKKQWDAERPLDEDDDDNDWDYGGDGNDYTNRNEDLVEENGKDYEQPKTKAEIADGQETTIEPTKQTETDLEPTPQPSSAIPQADPSAEDGEIAMDIEPAADTEKQSLSDMFAAKKQQLQDADEEQKPTSSEKVIETMDVAEEEEEEEEEGGREKVPNSQTSAILDLIITVAGEFYGQRDLLWSRQPWQKDEE